MSSNAALPPSPEATPSSDASVPSVASEPVTQAGDEFKSRGKVRVAARYGNAFAPADKDLPVIDHTGVNLTREQADAVIAEANTAEQGLVFEVTEEDEG